MAYTLDDLYRDILNGTHPFSPGFYDYPRQSGKGSAFQREWSADLEPRRGYIDARRTDGCVQVITSLPGEPEPPVWENPMKDFDLMYSMRYAWMSYGQVRKPGSIVDVIL